MIAEAVFVGTELLLGQIVNTNAAYLGERLSELGIDHYYQAVVGDNARRVASVLAEAIARADVVITSGGLGPTMDDLTRETVAELTGRPLVFDPEIWERIKRRRPSMPENMKRQAMVPAGATVLPNDTGSAPGLAVPGGDNKLFILLPGPPFELRPMFENYAIPILLGRMGERTTLVSRSLHFCEIGESPLEDRLQDLIAAQTDPTMATYAKPGDVQLRISTKASNREEGLARIAPLEAEIRQRVGEFIYGEDGATLEQAVGHLLARRGWRVAVVDACTGGTLAGRLTEPAGAEKWFAGGIVAASADQATALLRAAGAPLPAANPTDAAALAQAIRSIATVGVAVLPGPEGPLLAISAPNGERQTALSVGRGMVADTRWRISQTALAALRRVLLEA